MKERDNLPGVTMQEAADWMYQALAAASTTAGLAQGLGHDPDRRHVGSCPAPEGQG